MRTLCIAVLACVGWGCGVDCEPREGLYRVHMTPTAGANCGQVPDYVFNASSPVAAECSGGVVDDDSEACSATFELACPLPGYPNVLALRGRLTWEHDASSGRGEFYFELRDWSGRVECSGVYDTTYTRL